MKSRPANETALSSHRTSAFRAKHEFIYPHYTDRKLKALRITDMLSGKTQAKTFLTLLLVK